MTEIDNRIILGLFAVFSTVYGWLLKHLFGKVQYKDVCQANRDCMELKIDSLKELMGQRFDTLEELVKNGGK